MSWLYGKNGILEEHDDTDEHWDRNHAHNMTGRARGEGKGPVWTPCTDLTHCPSICDCPNGKCTARVK
jgi:hypothetical protein